MIEVQWTDELEETGEKRFLAAERFPKGWRFKYKMHRRDPWTFPLTPTREMWEFLLDALERRKQRREGIDQMDVDEVKKILSQFREPPTV